MDKYPTRATHTAWRVVDKEAVIVSPMESEVTVLNDAGTFIWKLMDGSRDTTQIAEELSSEFDVSMDAAEKDVAEFIEDLADKKLVTI